MIVSVSVKSARMTEKSKFCSKIRNFGQILMFEHSTEASEWAPAISAGKMGENWRINGQNN